MEASGEWMLSAQLIQYPTGGVSDRWQPTDEALTARLYMLEEQARPSVPSKSNEPLGATTLHAATGGSTMELLHEQIRRGWEGLSRITPHMSPRRLAAQDAPLSSDEELGSD
jgi:hypothetical protein